MEPRRWFGRGLLILVLAPLAACGSESADPDGGSDLTSSPVISAAEDWDSSPAAGISGKLTLVDDCLQLRDAAVFWPHGTQWDEVDQAVLLTDGSRAVVGKRFDGSGAAYDLDADFADLLLSEAAGDRVRDCADRTQARTVRLLAP
jgi:hypothetical protein